MSKGENIFKRKDGRWEARYIKGYELSGKIKYGFCYGKTYKEAKEKVTKFKAAMANGSPLPAVGSRHRFAFYCDEWLRLRKTKVKEATYIKYDTALEKHIKPRLGGCFPLGITSGLIDDFTKELLLEEELAPKTVHDILVVLHGVLKYTATRFPRVFPACSGQREAGSPRRCIIWADSCLIQPSARCWAVSGWRWRQPPSPSPMGFRAR